ncbi:MAG: toll/interleukin-1 receptor domain-containing protein [Candidatus Thiodiazotropha sp.]
MAIRSHVGILKKGKSFWNKWRLEQRHIIPDLSYSQLTIGDYAGYDLSGCNFRGTNASNSNFANANLKDSNFSSSILNQCILDGADCQGANFLFSDLSQSSLKGANLAETNFNGAFLINVDLTDAVLWQTNLGAVVLTGAVGLNSCRHGGPSIIDHRTVKTMLASGSYNHEFLQRCGVPEELIKYMPTCIEKPREYMSCFISYSHYDHQFAKNLYDALTSYGVKCWFDEHEMIGGQSILKGVHEGIRFGERVILCCSKSSLSESIWVSRELDKAIEKEEDLWRRNKTDESVIIPVKLDDYLFEWKSERASFLTSRYAIDFIGWERNRLKFKNQVESVLKALLRNKHNIHKQSS